MGEVLERGARWMQATDTQHGTVCIQCPVGGSSDLGLHLWCIHLRRLGGGGV
jgi:hypothetical protein